MATSHNEKIIEEFRANEGKVGGPFEGFPLLLLHHRGAKSGESRINPLAYRSVDDGVVAIMASAGGSTKNPDWYHNLKANPKTKVEIGTESHDAVARIAHGEERSSIWEPLIKDVPTFAEYESKSGREIPVVILELEPA